MCVRARALARAVGVVINDTRYLPVCVCVCVCARARARVLPKAPLRSTLMGRWLCVCVRAPCAPAARALAGVAPPHLVFLWRRPSAVQVAVAAAVAAAAAVARLLLLPLTPSPSSYPYRSVPPPSSPPLVSHAWPETTAPSPALGRARAGRRGGRPCPIKNSATKILCPTKNQPKFLNWLNVLNL